MATRKKWTIAIVMVHDETTFFEYNDIEQSIFDVGRFEDIRYVFFHYHTEFRSAVVKEFKLIIADTRGFEVIKTGTDFRDIDIYNPAYLTRFFQEHVINKPVPGQPDDTKYMVLLWSHAAGLGFFKEDLKEGKGVNNYFANSDFDDAFFHDEDKRDLNALLSAITFFKAHFSAGEQAEEDDKIFEIIDKAIEEKFVEKADFSERKAALMNLLRKRIQVLPASTLGQIFSEGFPGRQIEILLAITCFTQMIETGYELKEKVKLMIAPQTSIPVSGIDYTKLFKAIEDRPDQGLREIAINVRDNFPKKYTDTPIGAAFKARFPNYPLREVSIACNDLRGFDALKDAIDPIAEQLKNYFTTVGPTLTVMQRAIINARKKCDDPSKDKDHGIIDFINFINQLILEVPPEERQTWEKHRADIEKIKEQFCVILLAGAEFYQITRDRPKIMAPYFFSIFFPGIRTSLDIQTYLREIYFAQGVFTAFRRHSKWPDFVKVVP